MGNTINYEKPNDSQSLQKFYDVNIEKDYIRRLNRLYRPSRDSRSRQRASLKAWKDSTKSFQIHQTRPQKIMLNTLHIYISDRDGEELAISVADGLISHFATIQQLSLSFGLEVTNQLFETLAVQIGRNLCGLKTLSFNFTGLRNINNLSLKAFGAEISRNLCKLKGLDLLFLGCDSVHLTDEGFESLFWNVCRYLNQLKRFVFVSSHELISEKSINQLKLYKFTRLENVKLDYHKVHFTSEALNALKTQLTKCPQSLQELTLSFTKCTILNDEIIQEFLTGTFKFLAHLKSLTLEIPGCSRGLTDKGLEALSTYIKAYLVNLEHFCLNIVSCPGINNEGIEIFVFNLKNSAIKLKRFTLISHRLLDKNFKAELLVKLNFIPKVNLLAREAYFEDDDNY